MLKTDRIIIVEGKYDKIRLDGLVDAVILTTDGFGIFKEKEKQAFIKKAARERGIVIMTDSDGAGFKIRNFIKNIVPQECVTHVYVPDVYGKERRKDAPSKEGKLGVEGLDNSLLYDALVKTGIFSEAEKNMPCEQISFADLYAAGLSGNENSAAFRRRFLRDNALPERLSGNNLIKALNLFFTRDGFFAAVKKTEEETLCEKE